MDLILHPLSKQKLQRLNQPGVFLVYGPKGIGKTTAIINIYGETQKQIIRPEAGSIKLEVIRDLNAQFKLKNWSDEPQMVIIDDAHTLTVPAQNAMLKTLEELPAQITLVMVTDSIANILPTVASRCQTIYLQPPSSKQFSEWADSVIADESLAHLRELYTPAFAARLQADQDFREETLENFKQIKQLFDKDTYLRLQAASNLQAKLPGIMDEIRAYVKHKLRESPDQFWVRAHTACDKASQLLTTNVNKRYILDSIALAGRSK